MRARIRDNSSDVAAPGVPHKRFGSQGPLPTKLSCLRKALAKPLGCSHNTSPSPFPMTPPEAPILLGEWTADTISKKVRTPVGRGERECMANSTFRGDLSEQ